MTGNKVAGLQRLSALGLPVPPFRVVPDFEMLGEQIASVDDLAPDCRSLQRVVEAAVAELFDQAPAGFSLRSSASDEDTSASSAAGRYLSFNGLRDSSELCAAAVTIWRQHRSLAPVGGTCPLILQATHSCYFGGVLAMTPRGQASADATQSCSVETYYGSCRSLVDGMVAPYLSRWSNGVWRHTFETNVTKSRFVAHAALFANAGAGISPGQLLIPRQEPFPRQVRLYRETTGLELEVYGYRPPAPPDWYAESLCPRLVDIASTLDAGEGVDMEWGCALDGALAIYQVRPLTRALPAAAAGVSASTSPPASSAANLRSGLPAAPGVARGVVVTPGEGDVGDNTILFLSDVSVCDARSLERCAGVVTVFGGLLSHVSIACREMGIPCVVGIGALLPLNAEVEVDGDRGVVRLL